MCFPIAWRLFRACWQAYIPVGQKQCISHLQPLMNVKVHGSPVLIPTWNFTAALPTRAKTYIGYLYLRVSKNRKIYCQNPRLMLRPIYSPLANQIFLSSRYGLCYHPAYSHFFLSASPCCFFNFNFCFHFYTSNIEANHKLITVIT